VTEGYCVGATRGGDVPELNHPSVPTLHAGHDTPRTRFGRAGWLAPWENAPMWERRSVSLAGQGTQGSGSVESMTNDETHPGRQWHERPV